MKYAQNQSDEMMIFFSFCNEHLFGFFFWTNRKAFFADLAELKNKWRRKKKMCLKTFNIFTTDVHVKFMNMTRTSD